MVAADVAAVVRMHAEMVRPDAGLELRDAHRFSRHAQVRTGAVYDDNHTDIASKMAVTTSELM